MGCRALLGIGICVVVGLLVYALLTIPPGQGWDGKVHWGDVGGWLGGLGSMAAAMVSLYLARRARLDAEAEREKSNATLVRILSLQAQNPILAAASSLGVVRKFLDELAEGNPRKLPDGLLSVRGQKGIAELAQRAVDISGIPLDAVEAVIALDHALSTYDEMVVAVRPLIKDMEIGNAKEGGELEGLLSGPFQEMRAAVQVVISALGKHSPKVAALGKMWGVMD